MKKLLDVIQEKKILFDGGMGTQLIAAGLKRGDCPEQWNIDRSEQIWRIQSNYRKSGADILITNTFGATRHHLQKYGLADHVSVINRKAVTIARDAGEDQCWVAGDLGPTGLMFAPMGTADEQEICDIYLEQLEALLSEKPDMILIETQYDLREAMAALSTVRQATDLAVAVTMTFNMTRRGYYTMVGNSISDCCHSLVDSGADIVGANCTLEPSDMIRLAKLFRENSEAPLLFQPNAGQPIVSGKTVRYPMSIDAFATGIMEIVNTGAQAVGGCCGTTPEHIARIRSRFDTELP
jgi:5-methyltetrahydrofolate--homocysteine methyltransferase